MTTELAAQPSPRRRRQTRSPPRLRSRSLQRPTKALKTNSTKAYHEKKQLAKYRRPPENSPPIRNPTPLEQRNWYVHDIGGGSGGGIDFDNATLSSRVSTAPHEAKLSAINILTEIDVPIGEEDDDRKPSADQDGPTTGISTQVVIERGMEAVTYEADDAVVDLRHPDDSREEESSLLSLLSSLDSLPLVLVLVFLVDTPDGVEKFSSSHPPFRSVNRANELWERLCRSRWKDKFGYQERYDSAKSLFDSSSMSSNASPEFWYQQYYKAEADANRNAITVKELSSLTFSCRSWFDPFITPPTWKKRHRVWMSGLRCSASDEVKFCTPASAPSYPSGWITGHPSGVIRWYWQQSGSIINIENPRPSKFSTLRVRRLPNWGWELASDVIVLRAVNRAAGSTIDALWHDYTSILIDQPIPLEAKKSLGRRYLNRWREIPNIPELMEKLPWNQWDDE